MSQPKSLEERREVAKALVEDKELAYRLPVAIDSIDGRAEKLFAGWPERIYIVGPDGKVLYKGGMGPFDFDVKEAEAALAKAVEVAK